MGDGEPDDDRGGDHHVPKCQVFRGGIAAVAAATVPLGADLLGVDVFDVHYWPQSRSGRLGVQRRLLPGGIDGFPAGVGPHGLLAGDVEVAPLDLVRAHFDQVYEQLLNIVEVTGLNRERGRAFGTGVRRGGAAMTCRA